MRKKILKLAEKEKLTFYDATHIYFARKYKLKLATADRKLSEVAKKYVEVIEVDAL